MPTSDPPSPIRRLREAAGWTQAELARRVGLTRQAFCRMEGGAWLPNTAVALRLARELGTSVEDLFGGGTETELRADPQAPRSPRLELARVREETCAFATEAPAALQASFRPADALATEAGTRRLDSIETDAGTAVLHGCDPAFGILTGLLERREPTRRLLFRFAGSGAALEALRAGRSHLAGVHLVSEDGDEASLRRELRRQLPGGGRVVVFAHWEQGLMLAPERAAELRRAEDLLQPGLRVLNREPGAGCRVMFDRWLAQGGVEARAIHGYDRCADGHWSTAHAIACGAADVGLGLRAVAAASGLAFLPLAEVRCDLVVPADLEQHPTVRLAFELLQTKRLREELDALEGYDARETGRVVAELEAR